MWYDVKWCDVKWCDVKWCDVKWCDVMWWMIVVYCSVRLFILIMSASHSFFIPWVSAIYLFLFVFIFSSFFIPQFVFQFLTLFFYFPLLLCCFTPLINRWISLLSSLFLLNLIWILFYVLNLNLFIYFQWWDLSRSRIKSWDTLWWKDYSSLPSLHTLAVTWQQLYFILQH